MSDQNHDGYFEVFWPRSPRQTSSTTLAPRLDTLKCKTVALLWDYMFRGDEVFPLLEEELSARFPGIRFISWREFGNTHGANERDVLASLPVRLKELRVDAVISGMGC